MSAEAITVSATRLAACLGISTRRLNQLVTEGVVARSGAGFDLEAAVLAYCKFLRGDEETKRERRALLRAQTEATKARAARHVGESFTREEVVRRLAGPIANLWDIRAAVTWHRTRLAHAANMPDTTLDRLCNEHHAEVTGLIAQARDAFEALFPRSVATDDDDATEGDDDA